MSSISPDVSSTSNHKSDDSCNGTIEHISPFNKSSITSPPHNFDFQDNILSQQSSNNNQKSSQNSWLLRFNPKYLVWRYFVKFFKAEQFLKKMYNTDDFGVIYNNVSKKYEQYKKNNQLPKESLFFANMRK